MLPLVAAALIGAGSSLFGGMLGKKDAKQQRQQEYQAQKEFAQHGVRWRVEDAKAAGLHPLYALGAQTPTYSPSFQTGSPMGQAVADAGQHISRSVAATQTAQEREQNALGLELLRSQIGETDARRDYYLSEAARARQANGQAATFPMAEGGGVTVGELQAPDVLRGQVEVVPSQVGTASLDDLSVGAGTNYAWRRYNLGDGFEVLLPGGPQGNIEEALESVTESIPAMAAVIAENMARNPGFTEGAVRHYMGNEAAQLYRWMRQSSLPTPQGTIDRIRALKEGFNRWSDRFRRLQE